MPLFSSKLELTSAASGSGIAIADVNFIRGAFRTVANTGELNNIPVTQTSNGQIVWVEGESATYQATVTLADYINTTEDTVSWSVFTGFGSGGGGSADYSALSNIPNGIVSSSAQITTAISSGDLDMDGNRVLFSNLYSQLADLPSASEYHGMFAHVHATGKAYFAHGGNWVELANAGSGGDITSVVAGSGLSGGGTSNDVTVTLDTGSSHFIDAIAGLSNSGIFSQTGSYYSTNNNIEINGSLELKYEGKGNPFSISSGSKELIKVNNQGVLIFTSQSTTPTEIGGGMYRDLNGNFFLGM